MTMWLIILIVALLGLTTAVLYTIDRITKCRFIDCIEDKTIYKDKERTAAKGADFGMSAKKRFLSKEENKGKKYKPKKSWLRILISIIIFLIVSTILILCFSFVEAVVVALNLAVIWAIVEGIFALLRVFNIDLTILKVYLAGIVAVIITTVYMIIGYHFGANVFITNYTIDTSKNVEPIRIVQIADSHLGVTLNKDTFPKEVEKIKSLNPDIVVITGDYVDDSSSLDDVTAASEALSTINCKYGVFYSFGNHDKGMMSNNRGYDADKLRKILESNNIKVLEDDVVTLDNEYIIIGRADASNKGRKSIQDLVNTINPEEYNKDYSIVLDHQPNDYENEANAKVDLVLSGHTHGGQLLPINRIGEYIGANDKTYGHEKIYDTDFIVTSGISAWAIRFKTGTQSEIVVFDVK